MVLDSSWKYDIIRFKVYDMEHILFQNLILTKVIRLNFWNFFILLVIIFSTYVISKKINDYKISILRNYIFLQNRFVIQFAANQRSNKLPQALENCFTAWILMLFVIQQPAIKFDSGFYSFIRGNFNALLTLRGIFWRNVLERFIIKKNLWIEYN